MQPIDLYLGLVHFPVVNKKGEEAGSALTTIDLHDMARASATFGVRGFFAVTPYEDQAELAQQVIDHWTCGVGGQINPDRKTALERIRITPDVKAMTEAIAAETGKTVQATATSARGLDKPDITMITPRALQQKLTGSAAHVILFGTAWGLSEELIRQCDYLLEPIMGAGAYNHLSVRSAASIYLDRIINGRGPAA